MPIKDDKLATIPADKLLTRDILHVCVVVRDVGKTAKALADRFGIGPWEVHKKSYLPRRAC